MPIASVAIHRSKTFIALRWQNVMTDFVSSPASTSSATPPLLRDDLTNSKTKAFYSIKTSIGSLSRSDNMKTSIGSSGGLRNLFWSKKCKACCAPRPVPKRNVVVFLFICIILTQVLVNFDSGAIPVSLKAIKEEFGFTETTLGLLGALPYIGLIVACPFVGKMLQKCSQKWVVVVSVFFNAGSTLMLALSYSSGLLFASRFFIGLTQATCCVFTPVWVDEFALPKHATIWMGILQLGTVGGITVGYLVTGYLSQWRHAMFIQTGGLAVMWLILFFTPSVYLTLQTPNKPPALSVKEREKTLSPQHPSSFQLEDRSKEEDGVVNVAQHRAPLHLNAAPHHISRELNLSRSYLFDAVPLNEDVEQKKRPHNYPGSFTQDPSTITTKQQTMPKVAPSVSDANFPTVQPVLQYTASIAPRLSLDVSSPPEASNCRSANYELSLSQGEGSRLPSTVLTPRITARAIPDAEFPGRPVDRKTPYMTRDSLRGSNVHPAVTPSITSECIGPTGKRAVSGETLVVPKRIDIPQSNAEPPCSDTHLMAPFFSRTSSLMIPSPAGAVFESWGVAGHVNSHFVVRSRTGAAVHDVQPQDVSPPSSPRRRFTLANQHQSSNIKHLPSMVSFHTSLSSSVTAKFGFGASLRMLLQNKFYLALVWTLCALFYVVTGIQFWGTKYIESSLGVGRQRLTLLFSITAVSAPAAGVFFGSFFVDWIGGYRSRKGLKRTLMFCSVTGALASASGVVAGFGQTFNVVIAFIWFVLFFGATILPPATGMLIACVDPQLRLFASNFSTFMYHIFGYTLGCFLPGPFITLLGPQGGMRVIFFWSFFGIIGMLIAWFITWKDDLTVEDAVCPPHSASS